MKAIAVCLLVVLAMAHVSHAITCVDVDTCLGSCVSYLTGADSKPAAGCCAGIVRLKGMVSTTPDKRQACNCAKQAASHFHNIKDSAVSSLPAECGAPLPMPISTTTDCDAIN